MDSITKYRQSAATLRRMAARAYGADQVPGDDVDWVTELGFGMFNACYRLRLRDGSQVVVKVAPPPDVKVMTYEVGAMATELVALRLIHEHTEVPVPVLHFSDTSHELCASDYFCMSFIDGDNLAVLDESLSDDRGRRYGESLGALNRELNAVRGPAFGRLVGPPDASWRAAFVRMVDEVLDDGERRRVELGWDYDMVRRVVDDHGAELDAVTEPRLVEWDLWRGNVLIDHDEIVGLLDHERAFWGDPLMEHGFNGLVLPDFGDPRSFVRGYRQAPLSESERVRRQLYGVHVALIMVIETAYRAFADDQPYRWARAQLDQVMQQLTRTR